MTVFKCKMCGGDLEITSEVGIATCPYCDTKQTLPRLDDDRRANLYNRANHFRRNGEYDKAAALYEAILSEDPADAEGYWSLVLCRYGVEYIEDPNGKGRIPTCNRTSYTSIFSDPNYLSVLEHADPGQKALYEQEAKALDTIQKSILEVSAKEEPYDIFICYKQTDSAGNRTLDSVLAQDIYAALAEAGYRVFFAGITLETVLGSEYEAHIFAALQSAKAMVVVGTDPANLDAVWVKNEWSRYLALIKEGAKKTLIVAYKDMSPYDLPEALASLQAQDMAKIGAMQDLLRGIKKVAGGARAEQTASAFDFTTASPGVESLCRRAQLYLEDKDFERAGSYYDKVLDVNPEYGPAYMGLLLVELKMTHEEDLLSRSAPLTELSNYDKALRFSDAEQKTKYESINQAILDRLDAERRAQEEEERKAKEAAHREEEERHLRISKLPNELNDACGGKERAIYFLGAQEKLSIAKKETALFAGRRSSLGVLDLEGKRQIDARIKSLQSQEKISEQELNSLQHSSQSAQIKWRVLAFDAGRMAALVITENCIAKMPFDIASYGFLGDSAKWITCNLRTWLNTEFLTALPESIQAKIYETELRNQNYGGYGAYTTVDRIFCLSIDEAKTLFSNDDDRQATYLGEKVSWWLRSSGGDKGYTVNITNYGTIFHAGTASNSSLYTSGVRPAMWVKLD